MKLLNKKYPYYFPEVFSKNRTIMKIGNLKFKKIQSLG